MVRPLFILCIALLLIPRNGLAQESGAAVDMKAAFAGTFYPAQKSALESRLKQLFSDAGQIFEPGELRNQDAHVQTIIVPHAGYDYSGTVAAAGYLNIPKNASYKNIFIITSSHRQQFDGISVCQAATYSTPLGKVQVNRQIAASLIQQHPSIIYRPEAHKREQGIEVQLPFIQYRFDNLPTVIPIVMGSSSLESARDLAMTLLPWFTEENLFIISADFSRYPSYEDAVRIDQNTANAIISGNPERFYKSLRESSQQEGSRLSTPSGDWSSLMTLLYMSNKEEGLNYKPLLYRNSGDSPLGDRSRVVGYWAIIGHPIAEEEKTGTTLSEAEKNILLSISRSTLESYIQNEVIPQLPADDLTAALKKPASALVSLYLGEKLRGRIEFLTPAIPLSAMVQEMTIASATLDQRFAPVEATELKYITIEISILSPIQKISSPDEIDPIKHGVYLIKDDHSGLYLPGRAPKEQWSNEELLSHCSREKAGLGWDDWKDADIYIFETIRFSEVDLNPSVSPAL